MPQLPVPDAEGIYTFPTDLAEAHFAWQEELTKTASGSLLNLLAPHTGVPYVIEERTPAGRPVVVIEPHHDDFALSASGHFLTQPRPLTVITVFSRSATVDPALSAHYRGEEAVSVLRAREGATALRPLGACQHALGHRDAMKPYRPYDPMRLEQIIHELQTLLLEQPGAELLAPAAVTRHPDHVLVHEAARILGCRWFWEDVAFWPTYAQATCDQHLFRQRTAGWLAPQLEDITGAILDKLTLLCLHGSQIQPPRKMYRPIRHAWTVAADLVDPATGPRFAERFYRPEETA
ncbi:PIG-L deacetylase family protein [Streptomyces himalayensis]|uniref:PIG-L deacetylase family protein n=1 Tax=Streptomyces himalayensis TaxID=2820085 RepID=UPI0028B19AA7|nr:PIG-L family deacetylase [Streptomyces himalayensis]